MDYEYRMFEAYEYKDDIDLLFMCSNLQDK